MTNMEQGDPLFEKAVALGKQGKHREAADIFLDLASNSDNFFRKGGMLLYVAHAFKEMEQFDRARKQLEAVHGLLHLPPDLALSSADEATRRGLLIGIELEDPRISAGEQNLQEAVDKLDLLLAKHRADLLKPNFGEIYQTVRRDRAFLLADMGRFE